MGCVNNSEKRQLCRAIAMNGEAVGSIGIFLKDDVSCKRAETDYWPGEPFWGRGVMSGAIRRICAEAFLNYDIIRIFAESFSYNTGSRRALEKVSFLLEETLRKSAYKNGRILDFCVYALLKPGM